jgi:hypothetical protein
MRSYEFESQNAVSNTPEQARLKALKKQKEVATLALSAERKRQTIAAAQKQIAKVNLSK